MAATEHVGFVPFHHLLKCGTCQRVFLFVCNRQPPWRYPAKTLLCVRP